MPEYTQDMLDEALDEYCTPEVARLFLQGLCFHPFKMTDEIWGISARNLAHEYQDLIKSRAYELLELTDTPETGD